MGNKAVLNISKFSLGDTGSMASLLLPTKELIQDVENYDLFSDLNNVDAVKLAATQDNTISKAPAGMALRTFLEKLDFIPTGHDIDKYVEVWGQYKQYDLVFRWMKGVSIQVEKMYEFLDEPIPEPGEGDEDTQWHQAYEALVQTINASQFDVLTVDWLQRFYSTAVNDFITWSNTIQDHVENSEEFLDSFLAQLAERMEDFENPDEVFDVGFSEIKTLLRKGEEGDDEDRFKGEVEYPPFYKLLRFVPNPDANPPYTPSEEDKKAFVDAFEILRSLYNGVMLDEYAASAVEYPYFLDLGFDRETLENDPWGDDLHTLWREKSGSSSDSNGNDQLRIRDMFRMDRLNKVSAYETLALNPAVGQKQLDNQLQVCGVLSRLMQDDENRSNISGIANTSFGTYFLTAPKRADGFAVKAVGMLEDESIYTGTFRNFTNPTFQHAPYFAPQVLNGNVNFLRRFASNSQEASVGDDFAQWHSAYNNAAVVKVASLQGAESVLKIIGKNSYSWTPGVDAVKYLNCYGENDWDEKALDAKSYSLVDEEGVGHSLSVKAGVGDDNYVAQVARKMYIEIPFNENHHYSYLTFDCRLVLNDKMPNWDKHRISIEFSLDDEVPVCWYPLTNIERDRGCFHNLDENNSLYGSLKKWKPVGDKALARVNETEHFQIIMENNLLTGKARKFHISITGDFIPAKEQALTPDEQLGYAGTYVEIINPELSYSNTPSNITYANYLTGFANNVDDFWNLSATMTSSPQQYVLEVPHGISLNRGSAITNNYSTATMFSDVLTAKNHMDSEYRMQVSDGEEIMSVHQFRKYTGIDTCSDTISLYFDADDTVTGKLTEESKESQDENLAQEYEVQQELETTRSNPLPYKRIETIKAINRFQHDMKHKSNLFSVVVNNSGIEKAEADWEQKQSKGEKITMEDEEYMEEVRTVKALITNAITKICKDYAPVNNQLFKVYFKD